MNNRTDIVYESLSGSGLDKNIFNVVANITAEEWLQLISQKSSTVGADKYTKIIPYLIHTYDEEKIMEMIQKSSFATVSYGLVDAWFGAIYGDSMVADLQPSFRDIARKPNLLFIFEGHLLRVIESAEYEEDISSFITKKFKMILREYTSVLTSKNGQTEGLNLLIGATSGSTVYPPLTDYSLDRLESVNNFVCFLSAIDMCIESFEPKGLINAYDQELIANGQFELLIERNTNSRKQQYNNQNQFNEAFEYVLQNFERHLERFSGFMFNDYEKALLAYVLNLKGLNVATEEETPEERIAECIGGDGYNPMPLSPIDGLDNNLEDLGLNINESPNDKGENVSSLSRLGQNLLSRITSLFKTEEPLESKPTVCAEQFNVTQEPKVASTETEYSDLLIRGKKKNNNFLWFIGIALMAGVSAISLIGNGVEKESIIDKTQTGENNASQYKSIKVIEK